MDADRLKDAAEMWMFGSAIVTLAGTAWAAIEWFYRARLKRGLAEADEHVAEWLRDPVNAEKMKAFEQAELEGLDEEAIALRLAEIERRGGRFAPYGTTRAKEGKS